MAHQLVLIDDSPRDWTLDEQTREIGLAGLRKAREILAAIPRRTDDEDEQADSVHQTAA